MASYTLQPCRFESELRDSSIHDSWQHEAVAADLAAWAAAVRKRRDELAATQEAAMQARHQLVRDNLQASYQVKVTLTPVCCVQWDVMLKGSPWDVVTAGQSARGFDLLLMHVLAGNRSDPGSNSCRHGADVFFMTEIDCKQVNCFIVVMMTVPMQ